MAYPTPSDYVEALQFPDHAFVDAELAAGEVEANPLGLPRVITGAYAAVFRVRSGDRAYAVRCFLTEATERRKRYRAVARHLEGERPDALTSFEYQEEGVRVGEELFPIVKMPWVEGEGLDAFVERHCHEADVLLALRDAWHAMLGDLTHARIAHGDLQHGNVLVARLDGRIDLRLVDYDAMWVPALAGRPGSEVGHRNFQHPDRTADDDGPWLDRFPGLVVYTALTALAEKPDLWERYGTGENLLFQSEDFFDPASSALFAELYQIEAVAPLAEALARACHLPPAAVPTIEEVLAGRMPAAARPPASRRRPEEAGAQRTGIAHWGLPVVATVVAVAIALAVTGSWGEALAALAGGALLLIGAALAAYRRLSPVRRLRRVESEITVLRQWISDLEDERTELVREREAFLEGAGRLRAERLTELQNEALENRLKHHFIGELSDDESVGHRAVIRLKAVGVRNAFHATERHIGAAKELTAEQRSAVSAWREELARRYERSVPDELSPAEERRLRRMVERRLEGVAAEIGRLDARIAVQRQELAQVEAQADGLPRITPGDYLAYVLRLKARLDR